MAARIAPATARPAPMRNARSKPLVSATAVLWTPAWNRLSGAAVGDGCEDREPERAADLLGGVDQTGGQARLVWLGSGYGGDRHGHERTPNPNPTPASSDGPRTSAANEPPVAGTCENHSRPPATSSMPAIRGEA